MPTESSSNFLASNQNRNNNHANWRLFATYPNKQSICQIPLEDISLLFDFLKTQCPGNLTPTAEFNISETSRETYQSSNDYEETIFSFAIDNLKQHVNFEMTGLSCLDLAFTSNDTLINSVRAESLDKFSDHHPVEIQLSLNEQKRRPASFDIFFAQLQIF